MRARLCSRRLRWQLLCLQEAIPFFTACASWLQWTWTNPSEASGEGTVLPHQVSLGWIRIPSTRKSAYFEADWIFSDWVAGWGDSALHCLVGVGKASRPCLGFPKWHDHLKRVKATPICGDFIPWIGSCLSLEEETRWSNLMWWLEESVDSMLEVKSLQFPPLITVSGLLCWPTAVLWSWKVTHDPCCWEPPQCCYDTRKSGQTFMMDRPQCWRSTVAA